MVDGPAMPAPPPMADVVAEEVAKAEERVDFVMRVLVRFPFLGVAWLSFAACLSSAWAWERTFKRRRWWARLFRAERDDEENLEKKIVSSRWGVCEARYADVRIKVEKYGREGRAEGIKVFASGARFAPAGVSSGTMRCTSADSPWCRKMALFLTSSREKSHSLFPPGGVSPFTTGVTNRAHNLSHMDRKSGMEPAVGPTNES